MQDDTVAASGIRAMPLARRALLAALPALALATCGRPGASQVAQDAQLIVTAIGPVVQSAGPTIPSVSRPFATMQMESSALTLQGTPTLLDTQEFLAASQSLLGTLAGIDGLPPGSANLVTAATALMPLFGNVVQVSVPPASMPPEQARAILRGAPAAVAAPAPAVPQQAATPTPPPAAPLPAASAGTRFHVSADDVGGRVSYQFLDRGQVVETGTVADFRELGGRFAAFKARRLQQ